MKHAGSFRQFDVGISNHLTFIPFAVFPVSFEAIIRRCIAEA